ncbi:hypothetical protein EW146_g2976 [Bondarzewia mesenterica]|uniref:SMAD/FHA domain-containing protein n=1 Tax=Bondarzewia mesenterica TaxID=1095465 RepID=A0A4S4M1A2_9AGAM|nr:hypothetical protein EW146_g2976 [Bondarzewia mesenterica]
MSKGLAVAESLKWIWQRLTGSFSSHSSSSTTTSRRRRRRRVRLSLSELPLISRFEDRMESAGNESPPLRQTILGSFLRSRPRGTSQSHPSPIDPTRDSPPPPPLQTPIIPMPPSPNAAGQRRRPAAAPALQTSISHNLPSPHGFSQILRRRRSGGALVTNTTPQMPVVARASPVTMNATAAGTMGLPMSAPAHAMTMPQPSHRIRLVPQIDGRRSLRFDPIMRDVFEGDSPLRIGRFTDRSGLGVAAANSLGSNKLAFKSKVVSRAHAEVWCEAGGKFLIKDTKSSSGTFLNHVRLSLANNESQPFELKDGDTLQLGVDYQGGTEDIYKCVRIRIEIGREWQAAANAFNTNALRQLKALAEPDAKGKKAMTKAGFADCCICLFAVSIQQALFIAPCSHAFHYKCIRPLLETHHPAFSCPLCRTFADLEQDVEVDAVSIDLDAEPRAPSEDGADADMMTPALNRERDDAMNGLGAETEVENDGAGGSRSRRARRGVGGGGDISMPGGIVDLTELSDGDADMDDMEHDHEHPLPPLPEGSPIPIDQEELVIRSRSGSVESALVGQGSGGSGEGVEARIVDGEDRAVKRKR